MKALFTLLFASVFLLAYGQECLDPDVTVITDCGTQFDLCLDDYTTGQGEAIVLNVTSNDNLGIFDPCDATAISSTANGTLDRFDENHPDYPCMYYYIPNPGFVGTDSFYYEMNFQDTCLFEQCVCDSGPGCTDGKIWTINSMYLDTEAGDVDVYEEKSGDLIASFSNLQFGDMFFVDGSGLANNQTEWTFTQTKNGSSIDQNVHTSCSEQIFGEVFGFFRVISGCISSPNQQGLCSGVGNFSGSGESQNRAAGDPITTSSTDTTIVRITIEPLAIDFLYLNAAKKSDKVYLSWDHAMSSIPASIEIERSTGNGEFTAIGELVGNRSVEVRTFTDFNPERGIMYYRLKATELDGNVEYSRVVSVSYWTSGENIAEIFPNPGKGNFNVKWNLNEDQFQWKIYDNLGKVVAVKSSTNDTIELENHLNQLSQGMYMVEILSEGEEQMVNRVVVY